MASTANSREWSVREVGEVITMFRLKASAPHTWPQSIKLMVISAATIIVALSYITLICATSLMLLMMLSK